MALRDIGTRLIVENIGGFTRDMQRYNDSIQRAEQATARFAERTRRAGASLAALSAPLLGLGALSLRTFGQFEQQMARVGAVANASSGELADLTAAAEEMGRTTVFSARQAAGALEFMSLAGLDVQTQIAALPEVLNLAAAAQLDMATSADIVTNTMAAFELETNQLTRANDVLVTAFTNANTSLLQLSQALKFAGPVANAAGISFEETTAAIAIMGNAGIQSTLAGTALRGAITRLLNPTDEAASIIQRLGLRVQDAEGNMLPLVEIVRQLEASGLTAADAMAIFGQRAGPGMLALVSQGSAALEEMNARMAEAGGITQRVAEDQLDTFRGSMTLLTSQVEGLQIAIGKQLAPAIRSLAGVTGPIISQIAEWVKENPKLTVTLFAIAAVVGVVGAGLLAIGLVVPGIIAGFGLLTTAVGFLAGAFGFLSIAMGPITLIVLGIAAAIAAGILIWKNWATIVDFVKDSVNAFIEVINTLIRAFFRLNPLLAPLTAAAGAFGLDIVPEIPQFAHGGQMLRGGRALVGERGPEVVTLPAGAQVTPISRINEINVQAQYTNPQEPNSIRNDMEFILMSLQA